MKRTLIALIRIYKTFISPVLPPSCRFTPTCSSYMEEAVEKYGAARGAYLGIKRLARCHPFCEGGYNPLK